MYILAVITTFSAGIIGCAGIAIAIMMVDHIKHKNVIRLGVIIILALAFGGVTIYKGDLLDIIMSHLTSGYAGGGSAVSYRIIQFRELFDEWLNHILLGNGFGYEVKINYGSTIRSTYAFENMWMQLLVHTGIIGVILYGCCILGTIKRLNTCYCNTENNEFNVLKAGVLFFCILSFVNPYMNGSIGLIYYSFCYGATAMLCNNKDSSIPEFCG